MAGYAKNSNGLQNSHGGRAWAIMVRIMATESRPATGEGDRRSLYWRRNLLYLAILLAIWFAVSYGCGILLVDELNEIRFRGFKLGFWFAQQGAIYVFVVLIFVYVYLMNRLDRELLAHATLPTATAKVREPADDPAGDAAGDRSDPPADDPANRGD